MNENGHEKHHFEFADFRLYPHERLLIKDETRVPLTPRILDLLIVLVERKGELVSKEALLNLVWTDSFVEEGNISRAVSTLRRNLGAQSNGGDFIETVPKLGYRFIAPVKLAEETLPIKDAAPVSNWRPSNLLLGVGLIAITASAIVFYVATRPAVPVTIRGLTNLTNNIAEDEYPNWSPDGKKVVFTSNRDGAGDVYVMNADGGGVMRLTNTTAKEISAVWSPDGSRIVFDSERDGNRELYVMNSDGSDQTRLTFNPTADAGPVSFSPEGKRIAYARSVSDQGRGAYSFDIYTMNVDGSDQRQLTVDPDFDAEPIWSPDGTRILFISDRDGDLEIYAINPDGSREEKLSTSNSRHEGAFAFTADGKQVFCVADTLEKFEFLQIYLMNLDGTDRRRITSFSDKVYRVSYSKEAQKFAISSTADGNHEIYSMEARIAPGS